MKIRNGFVSNSSSSSFILIGQEFDEDDTIKIVKQFAPVEYQKIVDKCKKNKDLYLDDEINELLWSLNYKNNNIDIISGDGILWVGKTLARWSSEDGMTTDIDLDFEELNKISENLIKMGIKPKLLCSTYYC